MSGPELGERLPTLVSDDRPHELADRYQQLRVLLAAEVQVSLRHQLAARLAR